MDIRYRHKRLPFAHEVAHSEGHRGPARFRKVVSPRIPLLTIDALRGHVVRLLRTATAAFTAGY